MSENVILVLSLDFISLVLIGMASMKIIHLMSSKNMGNKLLLWNAESMAVYSICHCISIWVNGKLFPGSVIINITSNLILFVMGMVIMYVCILYVDYYLYQSMYRLRHSTRMISVLLIISILALATNGMTGLIYSIDEGNNYVSGTGYIILMIVLIFQLIYIGIKFLKYRKKFGGLRFFPVGYFMIPIIISYLVGIVTREYVSVIPIGYAISLCGITMGFLEEIIYKDVRTGFYNEYYLDYLMNAFKANKYSFESGMMFGINNFSRFVNDVGYTKAALYVQNIAKLIRQELPEGCEAMYLGEGKFLLLSKVSNSDYLNMIEENVAEAVGQSNDLNIELISCHAMLDEKKETDSFIREINEAFRSAGAI